MAMLAAPRRKIRYNLTPKGKPLFEDNDRFGTKMLEKMGWSKGKGLGKSEDGTQDFVRVKFKSDERGLGFEFRDDQWTEHDKNFNGLLENLAGGATACPEDCEIFTPTVGVGFVTKSSKKNKLKDKISGQSLEENSKKSKARVHYKKFTKGKDMSQYSEKDLANIFGKKASTDDTDIYDQFQAFNAGSDSDRKEQVEKECAKETPEKSVSPMVNTGVSINDYFKAKMAALKEKNGSGPSNPFSSNIRIVNNVEVVIPLTKRKKSTDVELPDPEEEEKIHRKKKKAKSLEIEEFESANQAVESVDIKEHVPKKKKKSKSIEIADSDSVTKIEEASETEARKKKQKSKKITGLNDTPIDEGNEESNRNHPESNSEESSSSKKKKTNTCILPEEDIPKKKTKKDKRKNVYENESEEANNPSSIQDEAIIESRTLNTEETHIQEENVQFTKSKKTKKPTPSIETEVSLHQKDFTYLANQENFLPDTYTISTFCAEKFRNLEPQIFEGSNLMDINGYGIRSNFNLNIKELSKDAERILRLWSGTLDKYTHSTSKYKMYSSYMQKVKEARRTKHKIPALKVKSLKRKHVFQCV